MSERYLKGTVPSVMKAFGEEKGGRIVERMHGHLDALMKENADDSPSFRSHSYGQIYPLIAFYRAMQEEGMTAEESYDWLMDDMMRMCDEMTAPMKKILKTGLWRLIPRIFGRMATKLFGPEDGFVYENVECTKERAKFDMMSCPYFEKFKQYDCPELCKICCASDDRSYGYLHPNVVFARTKTLARGGDCCDFEIHLERKK